jgi:SAM-dependent methyltransferase
MVHYSNCPVCNSANLTFYLKCKDWLVTGKEFDLYQCTDCQFILTQDHPGEKEIGNFYKSEDYISHSNTKKGIFNALYHVARCMMLNRKKRIIRKFTGLETGSLLDIGSGTGYFASAMAKEGWTVTAVEVNEDARKFAIDKFGLSVLPPDSIKNLSKEGFDCITLWHVLEHLENLNEYFSEINRLLKPEGAVLVALPNHRSFDAEHYKQFWAAYDVPRHLWHFDIGTFCKLADNHNFEFSGRYPLPLDSFYISILSEKNKGSNFSMLKGMLTGLKSYISSLMNTDRTSSLVYLLRKKSD